MFCVGKGRGTLQDDFFLRKPILNVAGSVLRSTDSRDETELESLAGGQKTQVNPHMWVMFYLLYHLPSGYD